MKKLVKVEEVEGEGLVSLMGQKVTLFCLNYFYSGTLVGVNDTFVKLEKPSIVYDTGSFENKSYSDEQSIGVDHWYVQISAIESYGVKS